MLDAIRGSAKDLAQKGPAGREFKGSVKVGASLGPRAMPRAGRVVIKEHPGPRRTRIQAGQQGNLVPKAEGGKTKRPGKSPIKK